MNITLRENETMQDLVDRLADSFGLVYDIAPVAYWYENLYENGRIKDIHFSDRMREMLGYKSVEEFPDELNTLMTFTHPDDIHLMLDDAIATGTGQLDKYDVQYRIRKADGTYIWCNATGELVKDCNGTTVGMYGAFIDITEEMELKKNQENKQRSAEVIDSFVRNYEAAFIGNLNDGSYSVILCSEEIAHFFPETDLLPEAFGNYFSQMCSPLDYEKLEKEHFSLEDIKEKFAIGETHALEYRRKTGDEYYWYRIAFNRVNEDEILVGLVNCDIEHTNRLIVDKMMDEYDAIYVVSLDRNRIRSARPSRVSSVGEFEGGREYDVTVKKFAETVAPKYRQDWLNFSDPNYMKKYMASQDHREYIYELPETDKTMRRFSIDVIERVNGEAKSLFFSFVGIDDAQAQNIKLQNQMLESSRIINALSEDFGCVNYVLLHNNKEDDNTVAYRTSDLLMQLIPGWEKEANFGRKLNMLYDAVVYEEDKERFFAETRRENILANLQNTDIYFINTRMVIYGEIKYYQFQFNAIREGGTIVGVVAGLHSIDKQMKKELEEQRQLQEAFNNKKNETLRNTVLINIIGGAWFTYELNKDDEVVGASYSEMTRKRLGEAYAAEPMKWIEILHPEDKERVYNDFMAAVQDHTGKTPYNVSFRILGVDGGYRWVKSGGNIIRHEDGSGELYGITVDISKQMEEQQKRLLGAVALSSDVLVKANIGLWAFELDEGKEPRMYVDETMLKLLGLEHQVSPEETYHAWYDHVDKDAYGLVNDSVEKMAAGEHSEVQYPWHHPDGHIMMVRCGGIRNYEYKQGVRIEGTHQDVTETLHFDEQEMKRLKAAAEKFKHENFRAELLNYMVDNDDDPIELLKNFAERLRSLIDCDQVIYRDLEETRIMVNSEGINNTWAVPIEYCRQCEHFDAHHPMYAEGYTEMDNCQEGWKGIPVYKDCPIKSSLTRIVYCDGEVAGYLAIHYVQDYHHFTDNERATIEECARVLSISLSRFEAKKSVGELNSVKKTLNMTFALSDQFDPIIVIDPETGEYDWIMSAAQDVVDNTSMSVHGEDVYQSVGIDGASIIHEEDRDRFKAFYTRENLMKIVETGETQETEIRWYIQTEGRYKWKYNKAVRMTDDTGKIYVVVGVIDTTEAKEKEAEYLAQKKLIEEQQALSDGLAREYHTVWLVEGYGEHRMHLYRSTGKKTVKKAVQMGIDDPSYDNSMAKYVNECVDEEDRERVLEATRFDTLVRETPDVGTYVVSYKRIYDEEGNVDYHQMCFAKAAGKDGTVNYILAYRDADKMLREQLEQQNQLATALSMAESANRAKTTFLNNMSHDIRTPMNAIIGYTGLAASHIDNKEKVQDYLSKISQSSDHLLSLINDVLDMSRIESGKMNLNEKEENLSDIIHTLRDIVQADIHSKQLDFYVDAVGVNDECIICDKLRLNQVLLNVLSNSIKYTAAGGTVSLRITEKTIKPNGYAAYEFCVKDNGMGMSSEFLKTIFEPFTRVKSSTVSGIQGTGLGMAITKNIVDMMGGEIDIQSEPSKGTTVKIDFEFKLQSAPRKPVQITELQGLRGLVVDDDANTCLSISAMLEDIGMREEWCTSGKEAVIRAQAAYQKGDAFKVYVIDWMMPDMNGIETARRIRKVIGKDVSIIILTAYDWSDIEDEAREAGVTAFVSKPMFPSDLHKVLSDCLGTGVEQAEQETDKYDFTGKKILLVEDNPLNREIATEVLQENGFLLDYAEDGVIAVEKMRNAKAGDYDVVLMDIQMPIIDGYEATKRIRALGTEISRIPILAMTANAFEEDRRAALEAGMNEHISKPIRVDILKEILSKFV